MEGEVFAIIVGKIGEINWTKKKRQKTLGRCRDSQEHVHIILRLYVNICLKDIAGIQLIFFHFKPKEILKSK